MPIALITGVSGQDGSYLAEFLLDKGYEVHGLARHSSTEISNNNIAGIFNTPERQKNFTLHYADITDGAYLTRLLGDIRPDEIYNLAAQSHVQVSFELPEYTLDVTAMGALRILEGIRLSDIDCRFYQASSSEIFGLAASPQNEDSPLLPRSPYGCAKAVAHLLTKNYREMYNMFTVSGIMFNHESPRRGESFVTRKISLAVARIEAGLQNELYLGNLDAMRDWGFAGDYVRVMWEMMQCDEADDFVIGTGEAHSVREFCDLAFGHAGLDWEKYVKHSSDFERPAEVFELCADTTKACQKLGWKPETSFEDLVKMMVDADRNKINGMK